jgi:uncharacterized protein (DUF1697 family)
VTTYVALLRGINVGGNNPVGMPALRACFEAAGFEDVVTYIQSGNVVFRAGRSSSAELTRHVEDVIGSAFPSYPASVFLRTHAQMRAVVNEAPRGYGADPGAYRYDVIFLKPPLTARAALEQVPVRDDVDAVSAGKGVLYHSRLISRATQSRLSKVVSMPIYQSMTIRNWNTTTTLLRLMDERTAR